MVMEQLGSGLLTDPLVTIFLLQLYLLHLCGQLLDLLPESVGLTKVGCFHVFFDGLRLDLAFFGIFLLLLHTTYFLSELCVLLFKLCRPFL